MSSPEHKGFIERRSAYSYGGAEAAEVIMNKGRLPKTDRNGGPNSRERKAIKDRALGRNTLHDLYGGDVEGMLFTFRPKS